jgi:aspartate/glutamate racemase
MVNIIDTTLDKISKLKAKTVGLLATTNTVSHNIYANPLKSVGIDLVTPSDEDQCLLMKILWEL